MRVLLLVLLLTAPAFAEDWQEIRQPTDCVVETVDAIQITEGIIDAGNLFGGHDRITYDSGTREVMIQTVTGTYPLPVGGWIFQFPNGDIGSLTNAQFTNAFERSP